MARYKLKLKQLDFVSLVDDPAQPNATCLLIKRKTGEKLNVSGAARLVKTSDELGLAFFWAFTSTNPDGTDHYDLHGDAVQADNEMIKAAAEFMEKGGAVDEMHDSEQTGRVVFAMPMTPEIAKAFGVETKTSGLMVAIRPSADAMAKLKDGTYRAVSIAGLGERIEARKSAKVAKGSLYTNEVDGHQHKICVYEDGSMYVEYATMSGAEYGHSHGIVFEGGVLTILADSGHAHELADGLAGVVAVPADAVVIVQASASSTKNAPNAQVAANKSTQGIAVHHGGPTTEGTMSNTPDLAKQIADLEKRIASITKLSTTEHALWKSLPADEAEAFLAKSVNDRAPLIAEFEKSNAVEYTADDGTVYRKSQSAMAKLHKMADDERRLRIDAEVAKRAADIFGHIAGTDDARTNLLKAIEREPDGTKREAMLGVIKSAAGLSKEAAKAKGVNPGSDPEPTSKRAELKTAVEEFAKANGGLQYEAALVKAIKSDAKIRDLYEQVRNEN